MTLDTVTGIDSSALTSPRPAARYLLALTRALALVMLVATAACTTTDGPPDNGSPAVARAYCQYLSACNPAALGLYASEESCTAVVGSQFAAPPNGVDPGASKCVADFEAQEQDATTCPAASGIAIPTSCGWYGFAESCAVVCPHDLWIDNYLGPAGSKTGYRGTTCATSGVKCANPGVRS